MSGGARSDGVAAGRISAMRMTIPNHACNTLGLIQLGFRVGAPFTIEMENNLVRLIWRQPRVKRFLARRLMPLVKALNLPEDEKIRRLKSFDLSQKDKKCNTTIRLGYLYGCFLGDGTFGLAARKDKSGHSHSVITVMPSVSQANKVWLQTVQSHGQALLPGTFGKLHSWPHGGFEMTIYKDSFSTLLDLWSPYFGAHGQVHDNHVMLGFRLTLIFWQFQNSFKPRQGMTTPMRDQKLAYVALLRWLRMRRVGQLDRSLKGTMEVTGLSAHRLEFDFRT